MDKKAEYGNLMKQSLQFKHYIYILILLYDAEEMMRQMGGLGGASGGAGAPDMGELR